MPERKTIFTILAECRSTAAAIADSLGLKSAAVYSLLKAEEADGNVLPVPIYPGAPWQLVTWKLTELGISQIN